IRMGENFDPVAHNRVAWDALVDADIEWSRPVGPGIIDRAREGDWSVVLIGHEPTPRNWFPAEMAGVRALCLASGGGQQGPVLAAAGANVTVFDISPKQLARDDQVASREILELRTVLGDMRDLSAFEDDAFDLIINPVSTVFCPNLAPVWAEAFRVLRPGGLLLTGFMNPDVYLFDEESLDQQSLVVRHRLPLARSTARRSAECAPTETGRSSTATRGRSRSADNWWQASCSLTLLKRHITQTLLRSISRRTSRPV